MVRIFTTVFSENCTSIINSNEKIAELNEAKMELEIQLEEQTRYCATVLWCTIHIVTFCFCFLKVNVRS